MSKESLQLLLDSYLSEFVKTSGCSPRFFYYSNAVDGAITLTIE